MGDKKTPPRKRGVYYYRKLNKAAAQETSLKNMGGIKKVKYRVDSTNTLKGFSKVKLGSGSLDFGVIWGFTTQCSWGSLGPCLIPDRGYSTEKVWPKARGTLGGTGG